MNQDQITATLSQINSKGLEASFSLSEAALENAQKLAELNYAASKDALVNTQDSIQQVMTAKDPQQVADLIGADALQTATSHAAAYQKKVTKVLRDSNKEFANVVDASIDQMQASIQDWVNTTTASAPAGSEMFVSSFKTVYGTMMQSFEQFRAATKEALITAEKTADQAMDSVQTQVATVKKTTAASRKTAK